MSDHEICGVNAAPYVLGSLTEEEHVEFVAHLESCAACREEVAALEVVTRALPAVAPMVRAPEELKGRIMATVRQEASLSAPTSGAPVTAPRRARGWRGSWSPALVAGTLAALAVALVAVVLSSGGGGKTRVIEAQVLAPRASAKLRLSGDHAELDVADMPQTSPGRVYEVWIKRAGAPQPTDALFTVSSAGDATVGVPGSISGVKEILVTSEPRGGSRVPTRPPVIVAPLA
jgi:anti-sigma factor RsiW